MHKDNAEIVNRMRKYLEVKEITYREFSKTLEISFSNLSSYLNSKSDIQKIFILLQTKGNINLEWLITGEGKPEQTIYDLNKKVIMFRDKLTTELQNDIENISKNLYQKMPSFEELNSSELYYKAQIEVEISRELNNFKEEFLKDTIDEVFHLTINSTNTFVPPTSAP